MWVHEERLILSFVSSAISRLPLTHPDTSLVIFYVAGTSVLCFLSGYFLTHAVIQGTLLLHQRPILALLLVASSSMQCKSITCIFTAILTLRIQRLHGPSAANANYHSGYHYSLLPRSCSRADVRAVYHQRVRREQYKRQRA